MLNADTNVDRLDPSAVADGNVRQYSPFGKKSFKVKLIYLQYDPAILLRSSRRHDNISLRLVHKC